MLGKARSGAVFVAYLAACSAGRLVVESMRVDHAHRLLGLRVNQWVFGATPFFVTVLSMRLLTLPLSNARGADSRLRL